VQAVPDGDSEALHFAVAPSHVVLAPGGERAVDVTVSAPAAAPGRLVTGSIEVAAAGSETLRVPWALLFGRERASLLANVSLSKKAFTPSDTNPAILTVQAGTLVRDQGLQIEPVQRLDILLYTAGGRYVGVMARLRDLLPGAYTFGITGRGPTSAQLAPGSYELRLAAWPTLPADAKPARAQVSFRIQ
jgi:hypothetical protein